MLCHLLEFKTGTKWEPGRISGKKGAATNYLDDFLFLAWTRWFCNNMIQSFLDLCSILGIPVALEKMEWAGTLIVFLGILLDGESRMLLTPLEKQEKALQLLNDLTEKKRTQIKEIQTLTGYLNFLTKAIFAGCTFTRRMYAKYANLQDAKSGNKLKPHYHIRVDGEFRLDCELLEDLPNSP